MVSCPIVSEGINLCALAESIKSSKTVQESMMYGIEQKKIKKALHVLGIDQFEGRKATKKKMAQMVQQYISENVAVHQYKKGAFCSVSDPFTDL